MLIKSHVKAAACGTSDCIRLQSKCVHLHRVSNGPVLLGTQTCSTKLFRRERVAASLCICSEQYTFLLSIVS